MSKIKEKEFTFEIDGKTVKFRDPVEEDFRGSNREYNKVFNEALEDDAPVKEKIIDIAKKQGLWTEEHEQELNKLRSEIRADLKRLKRGGMSLSSARKLAEGIAHKRQGMVEVQSKLSSLDAMCAQSQADNAKFNYMVYCLAVYDNGERVFNDYSEFLDNKNIQLSIKCSTEYAKYVYGYNDDDEKDYPENQFLVKYGFVDDQLNYINKDGKRVDAKGRLVNDEGFYVNEKGKRVDVDGDLIDKNGEVIIKSEPFLDKDGNPVE
jgi:hypothetical protein